MTDDANRPPPTDPGSSVGCTAPDVDEFALPATLFGQLPDWFFPAVGRVVAVSALLENRAQVLAETLAGVPQDTWTKSSLAQLKKRARQAAGEIDAVNTGSLVDPITPAITSFFVQATDLLDRRNGIVHAIWPAQPGHEQFGWRPRRHGVDAQVRVTRDNTRADLNDIIGQASQLILAWQQLFGVATLARVRATEYDQNALATAQSR